jgi:co-chaperonin GroES (HSP10)
LDNVQYLGKFKAASQFFTLTGNRMLIERLEGYDEVKTAGGLIVGEDKRARSDLKMMKPLVCVVLATGEGYTQDGDEDKLPLDCKPGDVVVLNPMGATFFSILPGVATYTNNSVGIVAEGDVQMRFSSIEHFQEYKKAIQG